MYRFLYTIFLILAFNFKATVAVSQTSSISGTITTKTLPVESASIRVLKTPLGVISDSMGFYSIKNVALEAGANDFILSAVA